MSVDDYPILQEASQVLGLQILGRPEALARANYLLFEAVMLVLAARWSDHRSSDDEPDLRTMDGADLMGEMQLSGQSVSTIAAAKAEVLRRFQVTGIFAYIVTRAGAYTR